MMVGEIAKNTAGRFFNRPAGKNDKLDSADQKSLQGDCVQPPVAIPVPGLDLAIQPEQTWIY